MRRIEKMRAAVVEHGSPAGRWRRHAESQKTHGGFGEDRSRHADRRLHDHGLNNVWQNVADDDAQIAGSEGAGGLHEFAFARSKDLSADEARVADPTSEREREDQIEDAGTSEGDKSNGKQNSRERKESVHQHNVNEAVDASAVVASDGPDDEAKRERCEHDAASYQHRDARSVNDARENVASEFVGAEKVSVRWAAQTCGQIDEGGILRRDPGSEQREDHEDDDEHNSRGRQRIVARISGNHTTQRDGGSRQASCGILLVNNSVRH